MYTYLPSSSPPLPGAALLQMPSLELLDLSFNLLRSLPDVETDSLLLLKITVCRVARLQQVCIEIQLEIYQQVGLAE